MTTSTIKLHPSASASPLARRLKRETQSEVLFDAYSRGRYSTDASIYQIEPVGVVIPKTESDAQITLQIAREEKIAVLPRGGGTSQCGQTVGAALVIDNSKYLNGIVSFDAAAATVCVQPGVVLDQLNAFLKPHKLWYPVDVSTSAQATLGGMAGNNSCGSRSIRYGNMVHNVRAIDAVLADGAEFNFGEVPADLEKLDAPQGYLSLVKKIRAIAAREAEEIEHRFPKVLRRVGGYNLDSVNGAGHNMAHLLVGSEGTLAYSRRLHLNLSPLPRHKTLGICHFPTFYQSMEAPQHIVKLKPTAVELVDRTMIGLARANPAFRPIVDRCVRGDPDAILLVEFAGDDLDEQVAKLKQLVELMGDLGLPGSVVEITDAALQREFWEVRKAGLNIMMSMKGDGKPVSFIEDCAVPLEHLAEYTARLTRVFEKHGTRGTWYAHASVGCLHVRPILNMREDGAPKMRSIAEEASELVREYKGAYSGEHGDGLVRSEWIAPMFGPRIAAAFEEIKDIFDPRGLMNPGKIVRPSKMDDRSLFRFKPGYHAKKIDTVLDWSEWGGFDKAVEMCNNNGHCRKFDAGTMCPSFRATGEEQHLTRGRANTLRLALSGQLAMAPGDDAFVSQAMYETMELCVSCKGCKRECPTGVDMAKMKVEFLHHYRKRHGLRLQDRLIAYLPRYAPWAARFGWLLNLRDRVPGLAALSEKVAGLSARRALPRWRQPYLQTCIETARTGRDAPLATVAEIGADSVALFVDTFSNYYEPANAMAAMRVLKAAGYRVHLLTPPAGERPLCCGRTFLASGLVDEARIEARRMLAAVQPFIAKGVPIVGLEPSCLLGMRDEFLSMLPGAETGALALNAMLFEEFLAREADAGRLKLKLKPLAQKKALLHGHCHQKAFDAMTAVQMTLKLVPELAVEVVESSCCGMAGSFGYEARHFDVSMKMAEASLLPKVRAAASDTLIVADGTSCRHQIRDGAKRNALHVARVLELALE
ncbi:MAG: lactate dehydrogenase [Betaproteobacteria bacterium]|nr:lactate dehydrogenase [Betaproteobacteria bacterium]